MKPISLVPIDKSGTITSGGTAQNVYTQAASPKNSQFFQNTSDTAMRIAFDKTASATVGILIPAGVAWEPPAGMLYAGRMSLYCATTAKTFTCLIS